MYRTAIVLACLICSGCGRRVHTSSKAQSSEFSNGQSSVMATDTPLQSWPSAARSQGTLDSWKLLAKRLLAPKVPFAFNLFSSGARAPSSSNPNLSALHLKTQYVESSYDKQVPVMSTVQEHVLSVLSVLSVFSFVQHHHQHSGLSAAQELRGGKLEESDAIESTHLKLTQQPDKDKEEAKKEDAENRSENRSGTTSFLQFVNVSCNETLVALTGHTNRTKLEIFGWHVHSRNLSEHQETVEFHSSEINVTDPVQKEMLQHLWDSERLLTPTSDPFADESGEKQTSFTEFLASGERRADAIPGDCARYDAALEAFMDKHAVQLDGESWRAYRYNSSDSRASLVSKLKKLMLWFKQEFPYYYGECLMCSEGTFTNTADAFLGYVRPSEAERADGARAARTELYLCLSDVWHTSRFPRYQSVNQCLDTRRGRCGEYSVLALRILQLLDYPVRWTLDYADHVWVEVMHGNDEPPIHADPCEAAVDEPLLYEGWGKNQTFIISFPIDKNQEVQDVTSHYTTNFSSAVARRSEMGATPEVVAEALADLNARRRVGNDD